MAEPTLTTGGPVFGKQVGVHHTMKISASRWLRNWSPAKWSEGFRDGYAPVRRLARHRLQRQCTRSTSASAIGPWCAWPRLIEKAVDALDQEPLLSWDVDSPYRLLPPCCRMASVVPRAKKGR